MSGHETRRQQGSVSATRNPQLQLRQNKSRSRLDTRKVLPPPPLIVDKSLASSKMALVPSNNAARNLLTLEWDARRPILRKFFSIEENLVEEVVEELDDVRKYEYWTDAARRKVVKCSLKGLNLLTTCRQLQQECLQVFLQENQFVAVIGRRPQMVEKLTTAGMQAVWTPPWAGMWSPSEGCFKISGMKFRPELTISWANRQDEEPVLVPLCGLMQAIYAVHRTKPFPFTRSTLTSPHLDISLKYSNARKTPFGPTDEDAVAWLGTNIFCWLGRYVESIHVNPVTSEDTSTATKFEKALQKRCETERYWDKVSRATEMHRRLRDLVVVMKEAIDAGKQERALDTFQTVATWTSLFFEEYNFNIYMPPLLPVKTLYSQCCLWISELNKPQEFGWSDEFYQRWSLRRLLTVALFDVWHGQWTYIGNHPSVPNVWARLRAMELMIAGEAYGAYMFSSMRFVAEFVAPAHLSQGDRSRWANTFAWEVTSIHPDVFQGIDGGGYMAKVYTAAERVSLTRRVEFLKSEMEGRFGRVRL